MQFLCYKFVFDFKKQFKIIKSVKMAPFIFRKMNISYEKF